MRSLAFSVLVAGLFPACAFAAGDPPDAATPLRPVPFTSVTLDDPFWAPRQTVNADVTWPAVRDQCEKTGRVDNFRIAAGLKQGEHQGYYFNDSDVYKAIEGASDIVATLPAGEQKAAIIRQLDDWIAVIAAAQRKDGYLNTYYQLKAGLENRWTNLKDMHELYCAGHLIEAGIAHHQATGDRRLLEVAIKFADHIDATFGPGRNIGVCGHPEVELALVRLSQYTGQKRYLDLARFFIDQRGRADGPHGHRDLYGEYAQDHKPLREQSEAVGHAVRDMYLWSAATDLAMIDGDAGLRDAGLKVWDDLIGRKMYITGGIGSAAHNEGFTEAYDLPNDTAYAESCASIALLMWAHRMQMLHKDARFADVMEQVLYNAIPASTSLSGDRFFYENPLGSRADRERQPWYECACCPPNILRLFASLEGYVYTQNNDTVYVNLYAADRARVTVAGTRVFLNQASSYPWNGHITIAVDPETAATFTLALRVPVWSKGMTFEENDPGERGVRHSTDRGYYSITREWRAGDTVTIDLPLPAERVKSPSQVKSNRGRVALRRGPVIYCLEGADGVDGRVRNIALRPDIDIDPLMDRALNVMSLRTDVFVRPVAPAPALTSSQHPLVPVSAVPYFMWNNRGPSEMVVWIPEKPEDAELPLDPAIRASASHCWSSDTPLALYDHAEPAKSADQSISRLTWWPRQGSTEWVQYEFTSPRRLSGCEVYWFDDTSVGGGCAIPRSWRVLHKDGDQWREVSGVAAYGTDADRFNAITFNPVETSAIRLEADLQPGRSAGILEWKLIDLPTP